MQLLADAVDIYEESTLARWWEWERASENRRQLTWSTGPRNLRKLAGLAKDKTDEEVALEDLAADDYLQLPADTWRIVSTNNLAPDILNFAESNPLHTLRSLLIDLSNAPQRTPCRR